MFAFMLLMAADPPTPVAVTMFSPPKPAAHLDAERAPAPTPVLDPLAPCTVDPDSPACGAPAPPQYEVTEAPPPTSAFDAKTHAMQIYDSDRTCSLIGSRCLPSAIQVLSVGLNAPD